MKTVGIKGCMGCRSSATYYRMMKRQVRPQVILAALALSLASPALAQIKTGGDLRIHLNSFDTETPTPDVSARIKVKTKRYLKTRAVFKIEGSLYNQKVFIEDAYLDYSPKKKNRITIGVSKKIIGLEFQQGRSKRLTIYRSPIYRKMLRLGLVGRQINLKSRWTMKQKNSRLVIEAATGLDGSRNYNNQLSVKHKIGDLSYGGWLLTEARRIDNVYMPIFGTGTAIWYRPPEGSVTLEMFLGKDAQRSEFERTFGDSHSVLFAGPKLEASLNFPLGSTYTLVPLIQSSFWINDLNRTEENTIQMLFGLNFLFGNGATIMLNAEFIGAKSLVGSMNRSFDRRNFYGAMRYVF